LRKLKVLVLCGGRSAEHRVSLVSAKQVLGNLDRKKYLPELVLIDSRGRWLKAEEKLLTGKFEVKEKDIAAGSKALTPAERLSDRGAPDLVFPVLHGPMGEDGTVQGMLELAQIPYVGCGVLGSALGMDKEISKLLCLRAGIPVLPCLAIRHPEQVQGAPKRLGFPLFVKPARLGSSVGVSKVKKPAELPAALKTAFLYDDKVLLEKGIEARELECALLGDPWSEDPEDPLRLKASVIGEVVPGAEFYSYQSKYLDPEGAELEIPARIPAEASERVRKFSLLAFKALDCYAMARADFLMEKKTGEIYLSEVNTIPGFTPGSMYPLLWKASGVDTPELLNRLIALALRRHRIRSRLKTAP